MLSILTTSTCLRHLIRSPVNGDTCFGHTFGLGFGFGRGGGAAVSLWATGFVPGLAKARVRLTARAAATTAAATPATVFLRPDAICLAMLATRCIDARMSMIGTSQCHDLCVLPSYQEFSAISINASSSTADNSNSGRPCW